MHDKAVDTTDTNKAKATEADEADEAKADDTIVANNTDKAGNASVAGKANESFVANEVNVIDVIVAANEAIVTDTANLTTKASKASFAEANELLANSISIVLYSLTKYCEVFAKDEGYFGMTISNNQHGIFGRCDWHCTYSLTIGIQK